MTLPTSPPTRFEAGATVTFRVAATTARDGTPLAANLGWSCRWVIRGVSEADAVGVADGSGWLVTLTASDSRALAPGQYVTGLRFAQGTGPAEVVHPVPGPRTEVTPDLFHSVAGDLEDPDERALRLLIAARDGTLTQGFMTVMIDGKQLMHYSLDMLDRAIARYEQKIATKGRGSFGRVSVRFTR